MIVSSASPDVRIVSAKSRCSESSSVSRSRPLIPMTAFIGVRISWLMAARNALLAWLALSAAACASWAVREQPGVLDRDRRLAGQPDEEVEVGLAERLAIVPPDSGDADHPVAGDQRRDHQSVDVRDPTPRSRGSSSIARVGVRRR